MLARILPRLRRVDAALLGPGDDAAVIAAPDGRFVVTTDMMVHGPDFRLAWSTPFDLGWKAAATNLTDVAAMGARPTALVVAIAAPPSLDAVGARGHRRRPPRGARRARARLRRRRRRPHGLRGADDRGDGVRRPRGPAPVLRRGARARRRRRARRRARRRRPAGSRCSSTRRRMPRANPMPRARRGVARPSIPSSSPPSWRPSPPVAAGVAAAIAGATAMLDVSDGLARDARRIAAGERCRHRLHGCGARARCASSPSAGGEDHGLLATFPAGIALPEPFERIGRRDRCRGPAHRRRRPAIELGGWDPYSGWDGASG